MIGSRHNQDRPLALLRRFNRTLAWGAALLAAFLALDWLAVPERGLPAAPAGEAAAQAPAEVARPPFEDYGRALRQIRFKSGGATGRAAAATVTLDGEAAHLEVRGVFMDGDPQALVVDKRSGKTLRVQAGQHIGRVSVLEIRKDGLILFYRGEKVKLPL